MSSWTAEQLDRIGETREIRIAGRHPDGSLHKPVIVWVVRFGDDLYTRSVNGPDAAWFRETRSRHEGHVSAGGVEADVEFIDIDGDINGDIDAAYRIKYAYSPKSVDRITSSLARSTTVKLVPHSSSGKDA